MTTNIGCTPLELNFVNSTDVVICMAIINDDLPDWYIITFPDTHWNGFENCVKGLATTLAECKNKIRRMMTAKPEITFTCSSDTLYELLNACDIGYKHIEPAKDDPF